MIQIEQCPVCSGTKFLPFLQCQDHIATHESFSLQKCPTCGIVITNPQPAPEQIEKYYDSDRYMPHQTKGLTGTIYALARGFTTQWKLNLLKKYTTETHELLDYGCGTGEFLAQAKKKGWSVLGVEPDPEARQKASRQSGLNIYESLLPVKKDISAITLWHVLEHVPDVNQTLSDLRQRIHANGTLFIAVPNYLSHDADHYKEYWAGYDVPRHLWHFSKQNMERLLTKNGFTLTVTIPMKLDAFYVSLLSEKAKGEKNPWLSAIAEGVRSNAKARKSSQYSSLIYVARP